MNILQKSVVRTVLICPLAALLLSPSAALAGPVLGSAQGFAVLGASEVTVGGTSTINGDIGVDPGTSYTGQEYVTQTGSVYIAPSGVAVAAQNSLSTAYTNLAGLAGATDLSGQVLGTTVGTEADPLDPGIYSFSSSAQLTGTLVLDAENDPDALFVFQIPTSTLTTATSSEVDVINGTPTTGVYWVVGSSATLGTSTVFAGNILAYASITLDPSASITCGRALAETAAVTLAGSNTISDNCSAGGDLGSGRTDFGSVGFSGGEVAGVPEPGTVSLLCAGLLALTLCVWQSRKRMRLIRAS